MIAPLAMFLFGCERQLTDVGAALPECSSACVVQPRDSPLMEVAPDTLRVWDLKVKPPRAQSPTPDIKEALSQVKTRSDALVKEGFPIPTTGFLLCHSDVPGERLASVLRPALAWKAVALAGRKGSEVGFVALGLSRTPDDRSKPLERKGAQEIAQLLASAPECAGGALCPILTVKAEQFACGELVTLVDGLSKKGRLVKISL